jgi:Flp pilus assembly protein TadB
MTVSRRTRFIRRVSIFLRRFDAPDDDAIGFRVPSGEQLRPSHFALIGWGLGLAGVVVAATGGALLVAVALWLGAVLFVVVSRNPGRWL